MRSPWRGKSLKKNHFGNWPPAELPCAETEGGDRPSGLPLVSCNAGSVLVHTDNRCADHLKSGIVGAGKRVYPAFFSLQLLTAVSSATCRQLPSRRLLLSQKLQNFPFCSSADPQ